MNKPHVLDGDDRLVGEGFKQLDLRRGEGAHLGATCVQRSNEFPLLTKRNGQEGAPAAVESDYWEIVLRADIGNVKRAMLAHPAITVASSILMLDDGVHGYGTKMSPHEP